MYTLSYAQENQGFFKLKIYNQSSFVKNESNYEASQNKFLNTEKEIGILSPKFAIAYTAKNGNTHELELNRFELNFNSQKNESVDSPNNILISGQESTNLNLSLRYEYTPASKKSKLNNKGTFTHLHIYAFTHLHIFIFAHFQICKIFQASTTFPLSRNSFANNSF
jgi:hypothetical protein